MHPQKMPRFSNSRTPATLALTLARIARITGALIILAACTLFGLHLTSRLLILHVARVFLIANIALIETTDRAGATATRAKSATANVNVSQRSSVSKRRHVGVSAYLHDSASASMCVSVSVGRRDGISAHQRNPASRLSPSLRVSASCNRVARPLRVSVSSIAFQRRDSACI